MDIISESSSASRPYDSETIRWQVGDTGKADPFFIVVLNNIALERPLDSGIFVADMQGGERLLTDKKTFTDCAGYLYRSIFGKLPQQADKMLAGSPHASKVRFHSIYLHGLPVGDATALVGEEAITGTNIATPRRAAVPALLARLGLDPDVVFIVTNSATHHRASAFPATDDIAGGGNTSSYDGQPFTHYYHHSVLGMAAIHASASKSLTAAHEFGHAFSSFPTAFIADLYVDGPAAFNRKQGRPIPDKFASYAGQQYATNRLRPPLSYPASWHSYHCELDDAKNPALMDNFWLGQPDPLACKNDRISTAFMLDRLAAKVTR